MFKTLNYQLYMVSTLVREQIKEHQRLRRIEARERVFRMEFLEQLNLLHYDTTLTREEKRQREDAMTERYLREMRYRRNAM